MMPQVEHNALVGAKQLASDVLEILERLFPARQGALALHEPEFSERAEAMVLECIRSTFVSSVGAFVSEFEARLADYCGAAHAVAMVNGTAAFGGGVAGGRCRIQYRGAPPKPNVRCHTQCHQSFECGTAFVDINEQTLGIDPAALDST